MNVTLPDGTTLENIPDGTTKEQIRAKLASNGYDVTKLDAPKPSTNRILDKTLAAIKPAGDSLGGLGGKLAERIIAPAEAVANLGSGAVGKVAGDLAGMAGIAGDATGLWKNDPAQTKADVANAVTYQPRTEGGKFISEYNPIAIAGKYVLNPIAQGVGGIADDMIEDEGYSNIARSAVPEAVIQSLGLAGALKMGASPKAPVPKVHKTDIVKNQALDQGTAAGLRASPLELNSNAVARQLNELADPAAVSHALAVKNRPLVNELVRKDLGLPEHTPLTKQTYDAAAARHAGPYREASALGDITLSGRNAKGNIPKYVNDTKGVISAETAVEQIKQLRAESNAIAKGQKTSYNPKVAKQGRKMKDAADYLESELETHAANVGRPGLVDELRKSRVEIAKIRTAERATKGGDIVANKLTSQIEKGVPLEGNMKTIAEFNQQAPASMRRPTTAAASLANPGLLSSLLRVGAKEAARVYSAGGTGLRALKKPLPATALSEALRNKEEN